MKHWLNECVQAALVIGMLLLFIAATGAIICLAHKLSPFAGVIVAAGIGAIVGFKAGQMASEGGI